jgi:hypothetical protein
MNTDIIKTGDVIFFHNDQTIASKIIKYCTGSKLAHVGIAYYIHKELFIIESQYLKDRRIVPMDVYNGRIIEVVTSELPISKIEELSQTAGKIDYGYKDLILAGFKALLSKIGINVKFKNYEGEICSEMVALLFNYNPSNISPIELFTKLLLEDGKTVKYSGVY